VEGLEIIEDEAATVGRQIFRAPPPALNVLGAVRVVGIRATLCDPFNHVPLERRVQGFGGGCEGRVMMVEVREAVQNESEEDQGRIRGLGRRKGGRRRIKHRRSTGYIERDRDLGTSNFLVVRLGIESNHNLVGALGKRRERVERRTVFELALGFIFRTRNQIGARHDASIWVL
jgi:hypothetical protein